jgi:hypothetical protein
VIERKLVFHRENHARYLIGSGKAQELVDYAKSLKCDVLIFDNELSPSQQRNWEELAGMTVADRQEIILDIFGARAAGDALAVANTDRDNWNRGLDQTLPPQRRGAGRPNGRNPQRNRGADAISSACLSAVRTSLTVFFSSQPRLCGLHIAHAERLGAL